MGPCEVNGTVTGVTPPLEGPLPLPEKFPGGSIVNCIRMENPMMANHNAFVGWQGGMMAEMTRGVLEHPLIVR